MAMLLAGLAAARCFSSRSAVASARSASSPSIQSGTGELRSVRGDGCRAAGRGLGSRGLSGGSSSSLLLAPRWGQRQERARDVREDIGSRGIGHFTIIRID
eukprot:scaffold77641_cov29-Tisochrysis_lutea.AAC.1